MRALFSLLLLLAACSPPPPPTATPTRVLSAPTLAPSPFVPILSSDQLYSATLSAGQNDPTAAALPNNAPLPPWASAVQGTDDMLSVTITLERLSVQGDLYQQADGLRRAGVLLLAEDRRAWGGFPRALRDAGYSALAVDWPVAGLAQDVSRLLESFSELGSVDPSRIIVIGAGAGADAGLLGCALDALCDVLVLVNPQGAETALNVLPDVLPRPVLVVAGPDDAASYAVAVALANREGVQSLQAQAGSGAPLLAQDAALAATLMEWLRAAP